MVGGAGGADMTTFSLHPVKAITTGEGGLVSTEDDELARRLRLFRTHGITKEGVTRSATDGDWYHEMQALGFNYRITDFQCALGLSQLRSARRLRRPAQPSRRAVPRAPRRRAAGRAPARGAGGRPPRLPPLRRRRARRAGRATRRVRRAPQGRHRRPGPLHPDLSSSVLPRRRRIPAGRVSRSRGLLRGSDLAAHVPRR